MGFFTNPTPETVKLIRYSDPDRSSLAYAAAVYLSKLDMDNIKRPLSMIRKGDTLAIFRGEYARFEFRTSKTVYDHLITYTTANMRACGGLRGNRADRFIPPVGDSDSLIQTVGEQHLRDYQDLVDGVNPLTGEAIKPKKKENARSVAPIDVELHFIFEFNFATLIESMFPQRIWTPGAQGDTKMIVQEMYELVHDVDPELWGMAEEYYGTEAQAWKLVRHKLKRDNPKMLNELLSSYGVLTSMWN